MPNTMLLNMIYDAFVSNHGDAGARTRAHTWLQELMDEPDALDMFRENTSGALDFFTQSLEEGLPGKDQLRQSGLSNIRKATDRGTDDIREQLAASGLSGSGAAANAVSDLYEQEAGAAAQLEQAITRDELNWRSQAAAQLLGIENMQQNALAQDRNYQTNLLNFLENKRMNELRIQQEQNYAEEDSFWGTIGSMTLGGMLGSVTGGLGSAAGASIGGWLFDEM